MRKHLKALNVLIILSIFPASALVMKDYLLYGRASYKAEDRKPAPASAAVEPDIFDYASIIEKPVFPSRTRQLTALASAGAADAAEADVSALLSDLTLVGTFIGPDSFAVIGKKGTGEEKAIKKGGPVFDAGVLKEIEKGRVVVTAGSRDISIDMPADENISGEPLLIESPAPSEAASRPMRPETSRRVSEKTGENEWTLNQKAILSALEDIGQILSDARLTPVKTKGTVDGFLVAEIKPDGIFDAIGLKNGDILKRVNGYEIVSPERAVQVLSGLKGETAIDLDILREGRKLNFHYEIR